MRHELMRHNTNTVCEKFSLQFEAGLQNKIHSIVHKLTGDIDQPPR